MSHLNPDELARILTGSREDREDLDTLEIVVTLRRPEEIETIMDENKALRLRIQELEGEMNRIRMDKVEVVHYGQLLARAKRELKQNGLPFDWIK